MEQITGEDWKREQGGIIAILDSFSAVVTRDIKIKLPLKFIPKFMYPSNFFLDVLKKVVSFIGLRLRFI